MTAYVLRIKALTLGSIPMDRLAVYLGALSELVGKQSQPRFCGTKGGSALKFSVPDEETQQLETRLIAAPMSTQLRNYERLNRLLCEDKASAEIRVDEKNRHVPILSLPGITGEIVVHNNPCEINGTIIRIGGKDETIPVDLLTSDGKIIDCSTSKEMARKLKPYLLEPIDLILYGRGTLTHHRDGKKDISNFVIFEFDELPRCSMNHLP
jgi:hypothetical protein